MTIPAALQHLTRDAWLLFATRFVRLFAYGSLSVVLVFYLIGIGLSEAQTGMLLTVTLVGDTLVSLWPGAACPIPDLPLTSAGENPAPRGV